MITTLPIMHITPALEKVLLSHGINPDNYGPAYNGESAAWDLYYTGSDSVVIFPGETKILATGLKIALQLGSVGLLRERGSAVKSPLILRAGVVDPGYTGEIFAAVTFIPNECLDENHHHYMSGDNPLIIKPGDKLTVQLLVVPCINKSIHLSADDYTLYTDKSRRREGQIGSSDTVAVQ